ncbi:hypothetical protein [Haliscomenobacter hydrossis]|uniref:Uncharacterized protein n=1 Tax=Haliscomenobacter hydrossis (strain ATCC 27775 / DSM 1100 / LMG 10767 / O) TaxID=760192 RepID=F4L7V8_HALH1|nr:hypothetical protein [Haliscomenobacter hydrossis]AEE54466.1 hypothetical protein Halhy_6650 [Haliscomenobacter hydrossis DSM 1100]
MQSILIIVLAALLNSSAIPVCVTMDHLMVGTKYGRSSGQRPSAFVFTENGIDVHVDRYAKTPGGYAFYQAQIESATPTFGTKNVINVNNISLIFNFHRWPSGVQKVTLDFLEKGEFQNLSINGSQVYKGSLTKVPSRIGSIRITSTWSSAKGNKGTLELTGQIKTLSIGGQELWIDNVCGS